MRRIRPGRLLLVSLFGVALVAGSATAYRHFVDRWRGSLRGPLIAGSAAGMLFIVVAPSLIVGRGGERP